MKIDIEEKQKLDEEKMKRLKAYRDKFQEKGTYDRLKAYNDKLNKNEEN